MGMVDASVTRTDRPSSGTQGRGGLTRRGWLVGASCCGISWRAAWAGGGGVSSDDPSRERDALQEQARKAGLLPFRSSATEHYLGIGDAPDAYREQALKICEALASAYQNHFQSRGFAVAFPGRRLTVITLKDSGSYQAFLGQDPGAAVGGHYDLDTNRLVIFDFRSRDEEFAVSSERINTFTLIHEAAHQLTFNTGLLNLKGDVPVGLSEGLAMYCELWRPNGRSRLGQVNFPRLQVLAEPRGQARDWIPLERLLADDALFQNEVTEQRAYAESWVFVHMFLSTLARVPGFRAYLDTLRTRRDSTTRLADARTHLGNLEQLDLTLRQHAARLIRGLP